MPSAGGAPFVINENSNVYNVLVIYKAIITLKCMVSYAFGFYFQVDGNIKSMYQLMAKVEELNKSMAPAYKLAEQVRLFKDCPGRASNLRSFVFRLFLFVLASPWITRLLRPLLG